MLETIEGPIEFADHVEMSQVHKAHRLRVIHRLCHNAMEEGILDIELMHQPCP
jgi:hypothetical protein